jgi:hypothetical protein
MKRTLTVLTAAIFASAIAIPAFAQSSMEASPAAMASPSSEKPMKKHHHHMHHKKGSMGMASPEASPSPSK